MFNPLIEPIPEPEKDEDISLGEYLIGGVFALIVINAWIGLDWLYAMFR